MIPAVPPAGTGVDSTAVVVLAGGRSERFGSDKTRAESDGVPLLARVLDVVARVDRPVDEVLVVGPWAPDGVRRVAEPDRFGGPLAALAFALGEVSSDRALVLAADHPSLQPEVLVLLLDVLASNPAVDAVVPVRDGRYEPLVAAYRRRVQSTADGLLARGSRSMHALLAAIVTVDVGEEMWGVVDPTGRSFIDIDRPEDLDDRSP